MPTQAYPKNPPPLYGMLLTLRLIMKIENEANQKRKEKLIEFH
jgi:hypothetical protein